MRFFIFLGLAYFSHSFQVIAHASDAREVEIGYPLHIERTIPLDLQDCQRAVKLNQDGATATCEVQFFRIRGERVSDTQIINGLDIKKMSGKVKNSDFNYEFVSTPTGYRINLKKISGIDTAIVKSESYYFDYFARVIEEIDPNKNGKYTIRTIRFVRDLR